MAGECQLHNNTRKQFNIGQVDFINCLPINLPIEFGEVSINANIINAVPSELNKKILRGEIDIAPVSSYAYLTNKDKLTPIANLCIASNGPADSVLLFSQFPIEELDGAKIALSPASATSNKLLEIILKEFLNVNVICEIEKLSAMPLQLVNYPARLLIGDHALLEFSKMPRNIFIYDLGSLWKKHTGFPMVFGIWVVRKDILEKYPAEMEIISDQLRKAKEIGLTTMFDKVIKKAQGKVLISKEFYSTYFQHLSYDFTDEYKKGLEVFEEYCYKTKEAAVMCK
ncbi:MAG: hypothetical protein A3I68_00215 [Candidatus Melainabacteria bacterium RIFCSPLOWO2_02_FULL_35_15]|nr:MAG: hypothetical protein A3I68_00215 [Candidatus Melainabacteria bacterium RIFCSPLOWO2_02_FULL_35_15]